MLGIFGILVVSLASGMLGVMLAGWGCVVLPVLMLIGGGIGSLGGVVYQWVQDGRIPRRRRRMRVVRRHRDAGM
jgi:hypothetical protein